MKKKSLVMLGVTAGLSVLSAVPAFAGEWKADTKGWWYREDNGAYPASAWKEINGRQYYFGADGYMLANTTTPDGYTVNADGAWTVNGVVQIKQAALEIAEVKDVKTLPAGLEISDIHDGYVYAMKANSSSDDYTKTYTRYVYDSDMTLLWQVPDGFEITTFVNGIIVVTSQDGHKYLYDTNFNQVADIGTGIYVQQFDKNVDPNGLSIMGHAVDDQKITFVGYGPKTGYFKKEYYKKDYPELKEVTDVLGPHNGMFKLCNVKMTTVHEGYLNQYGIRDEKIIMNATTLGELVYTKNEVGGYDSYHADMTKKSKFDSGAYFEYVGNNGTEYVLKDKTGTEKFKTGCLMSRNILLDGEGSYYIINNDTFIAAPQGTEYGGSLHLYKIIYK